MFSSYLMSIFLISSLAVVGWKNKTTDTVWRWFWDYATFPCDRALAVALEEGCWIFFTINNTIYIPTMAYAKFNS